MRCQSIVKKAFRLVFVWYLFLVFFELQSGQGKSTIIQLIENFYRPTTGSIEYYGVDMRDINVKFLRDKLGLVSQEPFLFDDSIKENIRFGFPDVTQEDIEMAAMQANAHNFIMGFPDGYDTQVGSGNSSQVSGGQKQRIAIARALLRRPKVGTSAFSICLRRRL